MTDLTKQKEMSWVLIYPEKSSRQNEITPLSFAIDGVWEPQIISINESLLADELVWRIEEEIEDKKDEQSNYYDLIYTDQRDPFQFDIDIEFTTVVNPPGCVYLGSSVRIDRLDIEASWGKDSEGISKSLLVKWSKELLISIIETQIHIHNK